MPSEQTDTTISAPNSDTALFREYLMSMEKGGPRTPSVGLYLSGYELEAIDDLLSGYGKQHHHGRPGTHRGNALP